MKKPASKRLKPLSLYPLKAEEALALFMRVDPAEVHRRISQQRGKAAALPKG